MHVFTRIVDGKPIKGSGPVCRLFVNTEAIMGQVGVVRCTILSDGTTLVVKYAEARGGALREEAAVYAALGSRRSPYFPVFYGLFTNGYWDAMNSIRRGRQSELICQSLQKVEVRCYATFCSDTRC